MLLSKEVEINLNGRMVKNFEDLGYKIPRRIGNQGRLMYIKGTKILIKVEDLPHASDVFIWVQCDYCGKKYELQYKQYLRAINNKYVHKIACYECKQRKTEESNLIKYGVKNTMSVPKLHKKQEDSKRRNINIVRKKFIEFNFTPLFNNEDYKNGQDKLKCYCNNHTDIIQYKTYDGFLDGDGCNYCAIEKCSGDGHWNWQGGRTSLSSYLRNKLKPWINKSRKNSNACFVTGETKNIVYHHSYPFRQIVDDSLVELKLSYDYDNCSVSDYTNEQLKLIKDKCLELHWKHGLAVCLEDEVHDLFHYVYGFENISMETLIEFKKRYLNHEFNNIDLSGYKYYKFKNHKEVIKI